MCVSLRMRTCISVGAKVKGVDLDAPGSINGVPVLEVDMESFEEKPWRKPGECYRYADNTVARQLKNMVANKPCISTIQNS